MSQKRQFKIWIITLFPEYFSPFLEHGVAASALRGERGSSFQVNLVQLRDFSPKNYKGVDDAPYGGGPGMIMRADILKEAICEGVVAAGGYQNIKKDLHVIYTGPRGTVWNDSVCRKFADQYWDVDSKKDLVFICGRYEGIDERFLERYVDEQISIGDYVLTGGELGVLTILDSALRFVPGVLGNSDSADYDSFNEGLLEHPQYTRPRQFEGADIPDVLASGHHINIEKWKQSERLRITKEYRLDLFSKYNKAKGEQ
jgi:tRNA (guanine37-N1)-methyltransferase